MSLTGGVILLLGVAGIATLMVQTVRQRKGEIGLRRAVGAMPFDIAILKSRKPTRTGFGRIHGFNGAPAAVAAFGDAQRPGPGESRR